MTLRKGMKFYHSKWVEIDNKTPMKFQITRIDGDTVYYRAVENEILVGNAHYCSKNQFGKYFLKECN